MVYKYMKLPKEFLEKMNKLLGDEEYEKFCESFSRPRNFGLRINTLKVSVEEFLKISPFRLEPVLWTRDGFYYPLDANPAKHPYYYAGLYYIQEPSAMLPAEVLDAKPGERVLDLCAAPGGKTVQIAACMKGKGILVANDVNAERIKALVKNIELCGVKNSIVTNETPKRLARKFAHYFDKILVDAPCSGEGMFRRDEDARRNWEKYRCESIAMTQLDIMMDADMMLKPGGSLVYSTCTFSPEENEMIISEFLNRYKHYELVEIPKVHGIESGRPAWGGNIDDLSKTARVWPHKAKGEGHFVALLLKKQYSENQPDTAYLPAKQAHTGEKRISEPQLNLFRSFANEYLNADIDKAFDKGLEGSFIIGGKNLYFLPEGLPDLEGIKVAKFGWFLGEFTHDKFEPSHAMAMALKKEEIKKAIDFSPDSKEILSYLKGETLMCDEPGGLTAICVDGYMVGWAKKQGGILKNMYPKGWRMMR